MEVMIYLGGNLRSHDEHSVRSEDQYPVVSFIATLFQLDRRLQNDLNMLPESLSDALGGVFVDSPPPVHC